ncbi:coiled-coil domain-containing protein 97 isoform X1 [Schistocerca piceifrons]|uniref:coiled-coil domain-containing protein 97 isoform X1 n=1 Tax=Schistocerca piceifrons TaxID=274613 RepID=UPI001F5F77AA|nr:coiled-coil domain-containing protein 97 isoform X1 [Schistocerca piceifrons]
MEVDEVSKGREINGQPNEKTRSFNDEKENILCENMLNHVAVNKLAHFKSQQVGEPELSTQQKRDIAKELLIRNPEQFLARFGNHLEEEHLDYFSGVKFDTYEIQFHLKQLRRGLSKKKKQIDIRNRRYQALKKLLDEGTYFSETEMMKRNPLLYEQLIGQFLTKKEIRNRDKCDENAKTFLSILMDQLDREEIERLKQQQRDDEEAAVEEVDTSDEESEENNEINEQDSVREEEEEEDDESDNQMSPSQSDRENDDNEAETSRNSSQKPKKLSRKEKELLREEFVTSMYQSFLDGNDKDFDYSSKVDGNPDYECLAVRTQDEEEKYFDAESPEILSGDEDNTCAMQQGNRCDDDDDDEEDELDLFMKNLKPEATPSDLATEMEKI